MFLRDRNIDSSSTTSLLVCKRRFEYRYFALNLSFRYTRSAIRFHSQLASARGAVAKCLSLLRWDFLYFCYHVFVKNCEDERVATGAVTKCTIDAMDALNLRALANELRQLDRKFPDRVPTLCVPTCVTCASKARKIHQNTAKRRDNLFLKNQGRAFKHHYYHHLFFCDRFYRV